LLIADKEHMVNCTVEDLIHLVTSGSGDFSFSLDGQDYSYEDSARRFVTRSLEVTRDADFPNSFANLSRDLGSSQSATVSLAEQQA